MQTVKDWVIVPRLIPRHAFMSTVATQFLVVARCWAFRVDPQPALGTETCLKATGTKWQICTQATSAPFLCARFPLLRKDALAHQGNANQTNVFGIVFWYFDEMVD
jgi:hypothetical protein